MRAQRARIELFVLADDDLASVSLDLEDVERRAGGDAQPLALADGEIVNARMLADDTPVGSDHLAGSLERRLALLGQVGIKEALVVSPGHETDFLRVRLFGDHQRVLAGELTDFGLGHPAEGEHRPAELILGQAKEKISLVLTLVRRTHQQPPPSLFAESHLGVMTGGDAVGANLPGYNQKLIKLQVIVAEAARDWRASGKILFDKRTHHIALKPLFVIDHVIRDADGLGDTACVVDVVERAAASLDRLGHALVSRKPALVPELHRQPDNVVPLSAEHGRNGRGIDSAGHSDRDGLRRHTTIVNGKRPCGDGSLTRRAGSKTRRHTSQFAGVSIILNMTQEARDLLQKALALPENERAELAGNLLSSLDTTVDQNVDAAWQQEVARRLDEVQSGKVETIPSEEVQQKGRRLLHDK